MAWGGLVAVDEPDVNTDIVVQEAPKFSVRAT